VSALVTRADGLARSDGTVLLVIGDPGSTEPLTAVLRARGYVGVASGTAELDPGTLEIDGGEVRLLVAPFLDPEASDPRLRKLSGAEAAFAVGSRSTRLNEVHGGALPALARLARRVAAYEVRYADATVAAREVVRLWSTV
jgi:hypothetical protein